MSLRARSTIVVVLVAVVAVSVGMSVFRAVPELVHDDLQAISQGHAPFAILNKVDAVCFDNGKGRADFDEAALRSGLNFQSSLNACGIDRSCCNLGSDLAGLVGLVRGNEIMCVEVKYFTYLLDGGQPICAKPSQLKVSYQTYTTRFNPPGRPWFSTVGRKYFQIGQQAVAPDKAVDTGQRR